MDINWSLVIGLEIGMILGMVIGAYNFGKLTRNKFLHTKKGDYSFTPKQKENKT